MNYSFDNIANMLDDIVDNMPDAVLDGLHGIYLIDEIKHNPKIPSGKYYVMGEFCHDFVLGHSVNLYYGSIMAIYKTLPEQELKRKLREILQHELRHHMETLAGCDDLVRLDNAYIKNALNSMQEEH